jgi:uncharacterized repeat protein (TIGR01451 family)
MKHVIRDGGSGSDPSVDRTRMMALLATFLLLTLGVVVAGPGVVSAHGNKCEKDESASQSDFNGRHSDEECDAKLTMFKTPTNRHGGNLFGLDFQLLLDGKPQYQEVAHVVTPDVEHVVSEVTQSGYKLRSITCVDDKTGDRVSDDGVVTLAAGDRVTCEVINDDIAPTLVVHKTVINDSVGTAEPANFQMTLNGDPIDQGTSYDLVANEPSVVAEDDSVTGYAPTSAMCTSNIADSVNNKTVTGTGSIEITPALAEHIECTITNDDDDEVAAGLTVVKKLINADGGNEQVSDFPLQVNGVAVQSGELIGGQVDVALAITETQLPGWRATSVRCVSNHPDSYNNIDIENPLTSALATIFLLPGEAVVCTITNDDIAPTVTVHKVVVGGTKLPSDFHMTVNTKPVDQGIPIPTLANTSIEVSELADPAYVKTGVVCTDNASGAPLVHPLVLNEGQNATCTVTNSSEHAAITVHKDVTNRFGGTLGPSDFHLTIDGKEVPQGAPAPVATGRHVVSELLVAGYEQVKINCIDVATQVAVGVGGDVTLVAGQTVDCTVFNTDIALTSTLTLTKRVITNDGGNAVPGDFHLTIDGTVVPSGVPQRVRAGLHVISEQAVPNYRLVAITCTDNDNAGQTVVYNGGVTLASDQHVTCLMTNDDFPIDLAITKSDDGLVKVAGGAAFDYTITVDNLGPKDALATEPFTVTDKLPTGFAYVAFPTNCFASALTLTCAISPAHLHIADPPFVLTVTVRVLPDAAIGTYINMAYVSTPADPACVGLGCVPVCSAGNNNVVCESTVVTRVASIAVNKVDDVTGAINPGAAYSYFLTVTNPGPSTFLADLRLTDDFPAELQITSVVPGASWRCNMGDPLECSYLFDLQAGETTPAIQVRVRLDPNFPGNEVVNSATATATVDPIAAAAAAITFRTEAPGDPGSGDPGTVVTASDDETTAVVRQADLVIDKSVSQTSAATGDNFNWVLAVTNNGPNAATNVVIDDSLPAQFEVLGAFPTAGLTCTNTISAVQCTAALLAVGETQSVVVQVRVASSAAPGLATNTATVGSDSVDPDLTNNTDSASIDIAAVRSAAPAAVAPPGSNLELPRTGGSSPVGPINVAALLIAAGLLAQVASRRRRTALA